MGCAGIVDALGGSRQQAIDLVDAEHLGQGTPALGAVEHTGWIVVAKTLGIEEFVQLPDGGEVPRQGRRLEAKRREGGQVSARLVRRCAGDRAATPGQEVAVVGEVAPIG